MKFEGGEKNRKEEEEEVRVRYYSRVCYFLWMFAHGLLGDADCTEWMGGLQTAIHVHIRAHS